MIVVKHHGDYDTSYTGTKEELLVAGIATENMFPEGRKRIHHNKSFDWGTDNGWHSTYRKKGGVYEVRKRHEYQSKTIHTDCDPNAMRDDFAFQCSVLRSLIGQYDGEIRTNRNGDTLVPEYRLADAHRARLSSLFDEFERLAKEAQFMPTGHYGNLRKLKLA